MNIRRSADPVDVGVVTDDPAVAAPIVAQLRARPELGVPAGCLRSGPT